MKLFKVTVFAAIFAFAASIASAQYTLATSGTGQSGTKLTFTTSGPTTTLNKNAFLGLSPLQGQTQFPFVTIDLGWPIIAIGMGDIKAGTVSRAIVVPDLPPGFSIKMFAQSLVVTPAGGGYQVEKTPTIPFTIFN